MTNHVTDKVIIVTGAAGGFGRLISEKAADMGACVMCADINGDELDNTTQRIASSGRSVECLVTDVARLEQMTALAQRTIDQFGRIDVMVNNASIMPLAFYSDHAKAASAWDRCIDINIKGVLNGIIAVYDQMIQQGRGHIVNLSSIYGNYPVVGAGVYGATKAAVNTLSESLRVESQGKIKVTIIKPTGVPGTELSSGIVNPGAIVGILGQNTADYLQKMTAHMAGELPTEKTDPNSVEYYALDPEHVADQILYAINQPWGVSVGDLTIRASGDAYIL
ncbi:MAG: SDR family oxidoreductase [Pseudomonadales bacterium]|nr:SDR family oxidoreductase [Pseudomonadales bacterium]HJN48900.1 SDR family oxidoreductase [Pseudomonadales bacterium]